MISTPLESERWSKGGAAHEACEAALKGKVTWEQTKQGHGYMTRGDTSKEETMEAVKYGVDSMLKLFKENL